jgi:hypothetical protein
MDAYTWWNKLGTDACRPIVEAAGTSWAYFVHIAHKRKRPGPDLARRLVEGSKGKLKLDKLLFPKSEMVLPNPKKL